MFMKTLSYFVIQSVIIQLLLLLVAHSQSVTKLHIDIDNFTGGTVSEVFDNIHFIPLETTKESLIGNIAQLEVTNDHFIVSDNQTNSIFFFKKNGDFEFKIKAHKPDRYIGNFSIDKKKKILIVQTQAEAINIFDLKGHFIKRVKLPFSFGSFFLFQNGTIVYNVNKPNKPTKVDTTFYDLYYTTNYDYIFKKASPYNPRVVFNEYNIYTNPFSHTSGSDSTFFSLPYYYNVYGLCDTGVYHIYKFLFPAKYSVPVDLNTKKFSGKKVDLLYRQKRNINKILGLEQIYKLRDNLLFTIRIHRAEPRKYCYNLETGSLISFDHIVGDSSSYFIPVLRFYEEMGTVFNNHIYSTIPTYLLDKIHKQKPIDHYSPKLESYFKDHNKWSNPFIIETVLKDNL